MDGLSPIVIVMPIIILIALFTGIALPFIAASRSGRSDAAGWVACADALTRISAARRKARPAKPGASRAAPVEYLYVPCVRIRYNDGSAETRRWVQQVPIAKKTAKWIYYTSDTWDRGEAVVAPGRISRQKFEAGIQYRDNYRHRPEPAGRQFFATREAAEAALDRGERGRAEQAVREAPPIKDLRRAMADAHPDRGGTADQFIQARRRYQTALRPAHR